MAPAEPIAFIDLKSQHDRIGERIQAAIGRVMAHGQYILGPEVAELERRLAEFAGARHAIACASGTDALVLVLMARDIGPGDAVIVPAFTFAATAEAVALRGATPVFGDIDAASFNMDPDGVEAAIAKAARRGLSPKAVIPVDLYGQPADYDAIESIAARHGLFVLADAAQSFGARYRDRPVGTIGLATATSFYPAKPLGCYGDGGAILTDDDELAEVLASLRAHGAGGARYDHVRIGLNSRLDSVQAAVLIEKLAIFADEIARRDAAAERYHQLLGDHVQAPILAADRTSVWAQYTIRIKDRDRVAGRLRERGIPTAIHYPRALHHQTAYMRFAAADERLPASESAAAQVLSLPMHPYLTAKTQQRIAEEVIEAVGERT